MMLPESGIKLIADGLSQDISRLDTAQNIIFDTFYPGGVFGTMTFFVPMRVTEWYAVMPAQKIYAQSGLVTVWEGEVTMISPSFVVGSEGFYVTCTGYWGARFAVRSIYKAWADRDSQRWKLVTSPGGAGDEDIFNVHINDENIEVSPKDDAAFASGEDVRIRYTPHSGEIIKRITYTLTFVESSQAWTTYIYRHDTSAIIAATRKTADYTGAIDWSLGSGGCPDPIDIYLEAQAKQTGDRSLGVTATYADFVIYTETGDITGQEIIKDLTGYVSDLSTDLTKITGPTFSIVPFVAEGKTYADIALDAVRYGDASNNLWAVYIDASDKSSDGKPIVVTEQYPALTAADYVIRLDADNVQSDAQFSYDLAQVYNNYIVQFTDAEGVTQVVDYNTDAGLRDLTYVTTQRDRYLTVDTTDQAQAIQYAKTLLAQTKMLRWRATGTITVKGSIDREGGGQDPVCMVRAGKRLRIGNFLNDISTRDMIELITATTYDDRAGTIALTLGVPDDAASWLARMLFENGQR